MNKHVILFGYCSLFLSAMAASPLSLPMDEKSNNNTIRWPQPREPRIDQGIAQLPNEKLAWLLDERFGMFIHWGLYSGAGSGEWVMENRAMTPKEYRKLATPESGEDYFVADRYDPAAWAALAKEAGMRWMCMTARHHDGFNLFEVPYPGAFNSTQTHSRDFVAEYVTAVRAAGLKVGIYFSPLNWRYPGYFDVTGTDCAPNKWGYKTDSAHHENARLMKEENYVAVKQLLTRYGRVDHIFWDGGWLGLKGSDADAGFFHEPGKYLDPKNTWPVDPKYQDIDQDTGRPLGIMGLVRKYQPEAISNNRYGWIGEIGEEEGGRAITGPIRAGQVVDKCLTIHPAGWGFPKRGVNLKVMTRDEILRMLVDCVIRDMVMLLNVGPDRHGEIVPAVQQPLREVGAWLKQAGAAVYGTRGGPWQPVDGRYGFCRKGKIIYVHILKDYEGETFKLPPVGPINPISARQLIDGKKLTVVINPDRSVSIAGLDRSASPVDTIIEVTFDQDVMAHALPCQK